MIRTLTPDECWQAVLDRDARQDGQFVFAVATTGIYCRPSCPARHALRRNVRFFPNPEAAERDGYRACLRCNPKTETAAQSQLQKIGDLCGYLEANASEPVTLEQLSARAGMSPHHLLRSFRAVTGLTPKQFHAACRMKSFKEHLRDGKPVTEAIYAAGYGSSSRLYERSGQSMGMTPGEYKRGGLHAGIYYATVKTKLGLMLVAGTNKGLCAVEFGDDLTPLLDALKQEYPQAELVALHEPYPESFRRWLDALQMQAAGVPPRKQLPLDIRGSEFQMRVFDYLRTIPSGETRSYGEVAEAIGQPNAMRAVGHACASNPVALTVPCHRVVRSDGETGGYRWGEERKRTLLDSERAVRAKQESKKRRPAMRAAV